MKKRNAEKLAVEEIVVPVEAESELPEAELPEGDALAAPEEEGLQEFQYEIRHDLQKRVDLYLRDRLPNYSRAMLQKLVKSGVVMVNGRAAKSSTMLRTGDRV